MREDRTRTAVFPGHRQPQQNRSRETVDRILAAADTEIGEVGLHRASTTSIAGRAELSVGAIYRFFRDKDEIADALAAQYLSDVWDPYRDLIREVRRADEVRPTVVALIEQAAREQLRHPGYYRLAGEWDPGRAESPVLQVRGELRSLFVRGLQRVGLQAPIEEIVPVVDLCLETVRHALVRAPLTGTERGRLVGELQVMLPAYLASRFSELS